MIQDRRFRFGKCAANSEPARAASARFEGRRDLTQDMVSGATTTFQHNVGNCALIDVKQTLDDDF